MQILLNVPDEYQDEFLRKFVPSGRLHLEIYGYESDRDQWSEFPADLEQVFTDGKNHREGR